MELIKRLMFPKEIFSGIEKKDGVIAILFFVFIFLFDFLGLYLVKISPLFPMLKGSTNSIYKMIFCFLMDLPGFTAVIIVLKLRKQGNDTVGLRRYGLKSSLFIGVSFIAVFWFYYILNRGWNMNLLYNSVYYIVFIGFYEEFIFRGFLWPRLVVGFGDIIGTVISGLFFGMMHLPLDIVFNNRSLFETFVLGHSSNLNIGGGLISALWFIFIYTRNRNILLPSFIHGIQDLLMIL